MKRASLLFMLGLALIAGELSSPAQRAIAAAEQAIAKEPGKHGHHDALALALARRARETANTDFYTQAERAIAKSLELNPNGFEALKLRCWVLLGRHEFAQALELAKQLQKRSADDVLVYGFLTDAHVELGNYKEAEEAAQWMLNLGRSGIPGLTRAAYLREQFGDIEGALDLMNRAFERTDPNEIEDRAWLLVQIGHLLSASGKLDIAGKAYEQALQLMPDYHYALAGLGKLRTAQGDHAEAIRLMKLRYEKAAHPENLFDVGAALHAGGQKAEARQTFEKFEKGAVTEAAGWENANRELMAWYTDYSDNPAAAVKIGETEIKRRRDIGTLDAYAWALHRIGKHEQAAPHIEAALAVGTVDPKILYHAGAIALANKDHAKAERLLRQSLERNGRSEGAEEAKRLLRSISSH
jgi:tetratricopeptide (TPR) repeat protein